MKKVKHEVRLAVKRSNDEIRNIARNWHNQKGILICDDVNPKFIKI